MRRFLQRILTKPVVNLANTLSSRPDKKRVDKALSELYQNITTSPGKRGLVIPFSKDKDKFIILSDQHKGARDGMDIFAKANNNYLAALDHYEREKFFYINLGDSEELWENLFVTVKKHNKATFKKERTFLKRKAFISKTAFEGFDDPEDPSSLKSNGKQELHLLKLLESVITNTKDAILITEAEPFNEPGPRILYVNEAFTKMSGYTSQEVIGKTPRILQGPKSDKKELKRLGEALRKWEQCEITTINYKKNGEEFWINMAISPVADENGWYTHWISIERDVTERKNEELQKLLMADISQLFNAPEPLNDILQKVLERLVKYGDFSIAEAWLVNNNRQCINLVADLAPTKAIQLLYDENPPIKSFIKGRGLPGAAWQTGSIEFWQSDNENNNYVLKDLAKKKLLQTAWAIPIICDSEVIGVFVVGLNNHLPPAGNISVMFQQLGAYAGIEIKRKQQEQELNQIFNFAPDIFSEVAAIKNSEEKNTILNSIGNAFFVVDKNWVVTYWNNLAAKALDINSSKILGHKLWELLANSIGSVSYKKYHEAMHTGKVIEFEDYYPHLTSWFEISAYPSRNGLSVYFKDITERKSAEVATRLSNDRYNMVAKATNDSIWDWDIITGRITRAGDGYTNLFGYEKDGIHYDNLSFAKLIHPKDLEAVQRAHATAFGNAAEFYWEDEYRFLKANGQYAYVYDKGYIIRDNEGKAIRMIGATQDITQQKKQVTEITRIKQNLDSLINTTEDMVWSVNTDFKIIAANNAYKYLVEVITGIPVEEGSDAILFALGGVLVKKWIAIYNKAFSGESFTIDEVFTNRTTGEVLYNVVSFAPIKSKQGQVTGVACFAKDISERFKYVEAIEKQNEKLREIAWIQSHVVRAPLANMMGIVNVIKELNIASLELAEWLIHFDDSAKKLDVIITDIVNKSDKISITL